MGDVEHRGSRGVNGAEFSKAGASERVDGVIHRDEVTLVQEKSTTLSSLCLSIL